MAARVNDMASELVKVSSEMSGPNPLCLDVTGLASGLYLVVTDLSGPNGEFAGRQIIKLLVKH